jgi:hypothetical protein
MQRGLRGGRSRDDATEGVLVSDDPGEGGLDRIRIRGEPVEVAIARIELNPLVVVVGLHVADQELGRPPRILPESAS